ncbi:DUF732 domain-containing protein [Microbacterium sp. Kw_RZR3]|uniref:DUF732 domain-containing protein n=1 Tax=Microbacterium sp. Kw_RZR3 TaxID=3032903 RepID=UPI0023DC250C|nr:DUF732 domain-containing protein [Microbacterium sp. Kw_RZR3]MDF2045158.1 DUF732 domain-containing protein [Microbacterium sp. Kw_RZR3]
MKRALIPGVLVLLLALAGCVSVETSESQVEVTPGSSGTYSDGDSTVVVEPSAARPIDAPAAPVEVSSAPVTATPDDAGQFLIKLQLAMANDGVKMTTTEILSAANYACDQLEAGADPDAIVALTGDVHEQINADFVSLVEQGYCPVR